jgi:hypothetical protein
MRRSRDSYGGGMPRGEGPGAMPRSLTPASPGTIARHENHTIHVTLNLFQGPFRRIIRGPIKRALGPQSAKLAASGFASPWALKQVQGDDNDKVVLIPAAALP